MFGTAAASPSFAGAAGLVLWASARVSRGSTGRIPQCWRRCASSSAPGTAPAAAVAASHAARHGVSREIPPTVKVQGKTFATDLWFNVPPNVLATTSRRLHLQKDHPVSVTRQIVESVFPGPTYRHYNDLHPVVSTFENFDSLGFSADHPGRDRSDTYYINKDTLLRTHTSAHERELFGAAESDGYLISADVYRRDEIDRSHYPAFHQTEGARVWDRASVPGGDVAAEVRRDLGRLPLPNIKVEDPNPAFHPERNPLQRDFHSPAEVEALAAHLKRSLELMVVEIFSRARQAAAGGDEAVGEREKKQEEEEEEKEEPLRVRWVEAYFPFTSPSWELEVWYGGAWLELLGCGVTKQELLAGAGVPSRLGWAFGIGLERIAMLLFRIPDIRLFWSRDQRFLGQFAGTSDDLARLRRFVPFSKHPPCWKDVSFWLPSIAGAAAAGTATATEQGPGQEQERAFHANDVMELVRHVAGDTVEDVALVDEYTHPKTGRRSMCYRINYRSLERTLTNHEANQVHDAVREGLVQKLGVELR